MAGNGYVYAMPEYGGRGDIHSIEVLSNSETTSGSFRISAGTVVRLHPDGDAIYGANRGTSPSDIEKYEISGGTATYLYDSRYHGEYEPCGNLWFSEGGRAIYTACGNVFQASASEEQDMLYKGALALSTDDFRGFFITSLSQSSEIQEIMLVERQRYCGADDDEICPSHINFYESEFLNLGGSYSLPPVTIDDQRYVQQPLFVFHSSDGTQKYVISRTLGRTNSSGVFRVHVLN
jgi:chitinase